MANSSANAVSDRSPPDSRLSCLTRLPAGLASTSTPVVSRSSGFSSRSRPVPPGNSVANTCSNAAAVSSNALRNTSTMVLSRSRISVIRSSRLFTTSLRWSFRYRLRASNASYSSAASGLTLPSAARSRFAFSSRLTCSARTYGTVRYATGAAASPSAGPSAPVSPDSSDRAASSPSSNGIGRPSSSSTGTGWSGPYCATSSSNPIPTASATFCISCPYAAANRSRSTSSSCSRRCNPATHGSISLRWARSVLSSSSWLDTAACSSSRRATTFRMLAATSPATASASEAMRSMRAICLRRRSFNASRRVRRSAASRALSCSSPACRVRDSALRFASVQAILAETSCSRASFRFCSSSRSRSVRSSKSAWSPVEVCTEANARCRSSSLSRCDCASSRVLAMRSSIAVT